MKKIYLLVLFLIIGIAKNYSQSWQWRDSTLDSKILKDANDNLYVFSNDTAGFTIKKLDANGITLWTKTAIGKVGITAYKMDGGNNLVLVGNITSSTAINTFTLMPKGQKSFFILKLSPSSTVLSANVYGSTGQTFANDIFINANGEYLIGGGFTGTFTMNGYSINGDSLLNFFIVKTDNAQNVLWSERNTFSTSSGEAWIDEVVETASGKIYAEFTFFYGLVSYKGFNYTSDGQYLIQLDNTRSITWTDYIGYPGGTKNFTTDIQTSGDTVYMKDYYANQYSMEAASIFMWTNSGTKSSKSYNTTYELGYSVSNGKIYYAFLAANDPYVISFYYRKIGSLTLGLSDQGQTADSVVTIIGDYSEVQYINANSLYIGGGGEGIGGAFVGKFIRSTANTVVENAESNQFQIFPNPSSGKLALNKETKLKSFKVYNSIGCPVSYLMHGNEIDLSAQPKGIYFVEIVADEKRTVKKIILE